MLSASILLAACGTGNKQPEESKTQEPAHDPDLVTLNAAQYQAAGIALGNVQYTNLTDYIKASGAIEVPPQQIVSITSPYGGHITSMSVLEGKHIGTGEVVAVLENPEFVQLQQDYMESSSQLLFLRQDLERQQELVQEEIAARKSLQKAQSDYNSMAARVEGLKAKLRIIHLDPERVSRGNFVTQASIYSPQTGYITKVYANIGKFVGTNEVVADLANTDNMLVRIRVFEKDVPKLSLHQTVRFQVAGDSVERRAVITIVGKDIHEDRTVDVQAQIAGAAGKLLPGMFVNAIIELGAKATPALRQDAIVQSGGKNYIFVAQPAANGAQGTTTTYTFRRMEVTTGVTENGFTAIGLPESVDTSGKIVTKGAYDLLSKMKNVSEEDE
ncbi:efflux RND transporter periplasmic adaptor subunit [Chitinophaga costaii]|nr:efflux RND transporter periplasmic adaptor subunit [Chitinophaga costaii]